jgi:CcmD family protein
MTKDLPMSATIHRGRLWARLLSPGLLLSFLLTTGLPLTGRADGPAGSPAAPAYGAAAAPTAKPVPDSEGFVPDSRPANMTNVEEGIPAGPLVATAYGFIWLAVLVFVGLTARRTRQLETEIDQLAERLNQATGTSPS